MLENYVKASGKRKKLSCLTSQTNPITYAHWSSRLSYINQSNIKDNSFQFLINLILTFNLCAS